MLLTGGKITQTNSAVEAVISTQTSQLEDEIRQRAYELFEARGREEGRDLEDWLRAEEEIRGQDAVVAA